MSRFLIACSLIAALTTTALARTVEQPSRFAQPPAVEITEPAEAFAPQYVVDRAAVRAKLIANRAANLARFRAYQRKSVFPSNTYQRGKLNVWIDDAGNLCAAATIISASGFNDLVMDVRDVDNFIRLGSVTSGPLFDWILTSGLTQAEIAAIQLPFEGVARPMPAPELSLVDARLRKIEDARLIRLYKQVDARIVKNQKASLDRAVDRLMKHPALAKQLVES